MQAIRQKCLDCCCGNASEVRKCVATDCALWPFRLASNPFRKRVVLSEEEKPRRTAQLKRLEQGDKSKTVYSVRPILVATWTGRFLSGDRAKARPLTNGSYHGPLAHSQPARRAEPWDHDRGD